MQIIPGRPLHFLQGNIISAAAAPGFVIGVLEELERLKKARNAVILAHNYQLPEVQDAADFVGDSLELALKATEVDADVVVMAGVGFMAEMVALLNPDKVVLHPNPAAGCPLANHLSGGVAGEYRAKYPGAPLVVYVNSPVEAKAIADYVVTSSSAVRLVSRLGAERVLFGPDKNLAEYVAEKTGAEVIPVPSGGHCPIHEFLISKYYVEKALRENPGAELIVHPEAPRDVRRMASFVGSTSQMLEYVRETSARRVLVGTEEGLVYRARKLAPGKEVLPVNPRAVCTDMKKITPKHILESLERLEPRVRLEGEVARRAREVLERSLEMVRGK